MAIDILLAANIPAPDVAELERHYTVHRLDKAEDPDALLADVGPRVRGLVTSGFRGYRKALLDALPVVEIVSVWGAGISELDLDAARARGIAVTVTPDDSKIAVAELGLALMLAAARWLPDGDALVRSGRWADEGYSRMGLGLAGRCCGIVALGTIGAAVAARAAAFDMQVRYFGPREKSGVPYGFVPDLHDLARQADFLILCCPNTPETRGMIGESVLQALGPQGTLVNIARGPVVDEPALVRAIEAGTIRAAALDVYVDEPRVPEALRASDRVVLAPHIGTQIEDVRDKRKRLFIENLQAHFAGNPPNERARVLP